MAINYTSGLNFTAPSKGDTDWDVTEAAKDLKISAHDHTGGGKGLQIGASAIADDSMGATKVRLANNTALRGRNQAGSGDVNIIKVDTNNVVEIPTVARFSSSETLSGGGAEAASIATQLTICNKAAGGVSLANGYEGQMKVICNINAAAVVVTPATSSGVNTATLDQYEAVLYIYISGEWRAFAGAGAAIA